MGKVKSAKIISFFGIMAFVCSDQTNRLDYVLERLERLQAQNDQILAKNDQMQEQIDQVQAENDEFRAKFEQIEGKNDLLEQKV